MTAQMLQIYMSCWQMDRAGSSSSHSLQVPCLRHLIDGQVANVPTQHFMYKRIFPTFCLSIALHGSHGHSRYGSNVVP